MDMAYVGQLFASHAKHVQQKTNKIYFYDARTRALLNIHIKV